jgi:hypothetical protein
MTPLLAASDYGLVAASALVLLLFLIVGWVIIQGTRAQLFWRQRVDEGDIDVIQMLVSDEISRWKSMRMPKGTDPAVWHGVQSAELVEVLPDGVRITAIAEGQYQTVNGERRQVSGVLRDGMRVTAKVADMALYDIPNVRLPWVQVDVYTTYRDDTGSSQRCVISTVAGRELADGLAWDEMDAQDVVDAFGGRYSLDDRGNPLPIEPHGEPKGEPERQPKTPVPAVFYEDD